MKTKMTVREKNMMAVLIALVIFCVYYFVFLVPVTEKIDNYENEILLLEDQIILADAKAVIQNRARVAKKRGVDAIASPVACGSINGRRIIAADIRSCIVTIHQRFVLMISTNGLHKGFITHGRYSKLVYIAISPLGIPILVNIMTDMLLTMKYGIPSAK